MTLVAPPPPRAGAAGAIEGGKALALCSGCSADLTHPAAAVGWPFVERMCVWEEGGIRVWINTAPAIART